MITLSRHITRGTSIDLHSHSWYSDGTLAPCEVARRMARDGVRIGALSDHDTLAGVPEFQREAALHGLLSLPAVEVSCSCAALRPLREAALAAKEATRASHDQDSGPSEPRLDEVEVHLLVYGIHPGALELELFLAGIRRMRRERVHEMLERLGALGMPLDPEQLGARWESGSVGRPHLAHLLVKEGHVKTVNEAFQRWLAEGRPAWIPKDLPEVGEALNLAHRLGGIAIAAHPGKVLPPGSALALITLGVDGLEVRHPSHRSALQQSLHELCKRNRISASAGSDFHDPVQGRYRAPEWRRDEVGGKLQILLDNMD